MRSSENWRVYVIFQRTNVQGLIVVILVIGRFATVLREVSWQHLTAQQFQRERKFTWFAASSLILVMAFEASCKE